MGDVWQTILACDAQSNAYRGSGNPFLKSLYIRRRTQLLREKSFSPVPDESLRKQYLQFRVSLLQKKYGIPRDLIPNPRSRSVSARSINLSGNDSKTVTSVVDTLTVHHMLDHHKDMITSIRFANDEPCRMAVSSADGIISVCQTSTNPIKVLCLLQGHAAGVTDVQWSGGNEWILSCSLDGTIRLWDSESGHCLRVFQDSVRSSILCCAFLPSNNNMVAVGSKKGLVEMLNISTGIFPVSGTSQVGSSVNCLTFDGLGRLLWTGDERGYIVSFLVDPATGRLTKGRRLQVQPSMLSRGPSVTSLAFSAWSGKGGHDPCLLVSCAANAIFLYRVMDAEGGISLRRRCPIAHQQCHIRSDFCAISASPGVWTPNIVSGGEDGCVHFLRADESSVTTKRLQGHASPVTAVAVNPGGTSVASGDSRGIIVFWRKL